MKSAQRERWMISRWRKRRSIDEGTHIRFEWTRKYTATRTLGERLRDAL
jgi:hypothetical protein